MLNKNTMHDFVLSMLKEQLPENYYYHNYEHTLYVLSKVEEIGMAEQCTTEELDLLRTAALWHDTGYIHKYQGHEEESCLLAQMFLPLCGYSSSNINKIKGMIMATKILQTPTNKLEEILADADLEYLGTENAAKVAYLLYQELHSIDNSLTFEKYNLMQISFLHSHHYFTDYCKKTKNPTRNEYLEYLIADSEDQEFD